MSDTLHKTKSDIDELLDSLVGLNHQLILYNDDYNTFEWVIESLIKVCQHHPQQAEQCSMIVHFKGKCTVKEGSKDRLSPLKEALVDRGLSATIE